MIFVVGLVLLVAWPLYNLALVAHSVRDARAARRLRRFDATAPTLDEPETFWIIVPCLNEERVVGRTVRSALALRGRHGTRTQVVVVDDGSDDSTPAVLAGIDHNHLHVLRRELPEARQGKGEALNAAYRFIRDHVAATGQDPRKVAVGVIDGDGRGSPNMLTAVGRAMRDPQIGAVQCRVRIHNRDHVLGAMQDLEFACVANASQLLRNSLGTVGLGGNGQFVRLSTLMLLGEQPWSKCLVEDLELGLRIHLAGVGVRYLSHASVNQQGLVDVKRLLRQRTRWAQGNLQCASYVPKLIGSRTITNSALLEMLYYLLAPWFNAAGTLVMFGMWGYAAWCLTPWSDYFFLVNSVTQLAVALAVWSAVLTMPSVLWALVHRRLLRDERLSRILRAGLVYPAFLFLGLISTWRAIGRQLTGRQTWAKTERLAEEPTRPNPQPIAPAQDPVPPPHLIQTNAWFESASDARRHLVQSGA
jgi:1,2-diacylglycerol 3-beta-glucosyltransferase